MNGVTVGDVPGREKPLYGLQWSSEAQQASGSRTDRPFGRQLAPLGVSPQESVFTLELKRSAPVGIRQGARALVFRSRIV